MGEAYVSGHDWVLREVTGGGKIEGSDFDEFLACSNIATIGIR